MNSPPFEGPLALLGTAVSMLSQPIVITDFRQAENPVVYVNPAFTALTGYTEAEAIGRNCRFMQGPGTDRRVLAEIRAAVAQGVPIRRELLNYRRDGSAFWNELTIDPVRDSSGTITHMVGVQRDRSELHAAIEQRIDAEQKLATITANMPGFVFRITADAEGKIALSYVSFSLARMLGLPEDETLDQAQVLALIHQADRPKVHQAILESMQSMTPLHAEMRLVSLQGEERWVRAISAPKKLEDGTVVWDGLAVDIDAEKSSELRLAYLTGFDPLTGLSTARSSTACCTRRSNVVLRGGHRSRCSTWHWTISGR